MSHTKLSFIGAGNMAEAIFAAVTSKQLYAFNDICFSSRTSDKLVKYNSLHVYTTLDNVKAVEFGDIIILAVKPQSFDEVLDEISSASAGKCIVSLAPGISTDYISSKCPGAYVVRTMPNTPLLIGNGTTAVCKNASVPEDIFKNVVDIFSCAGMVHIITEDKMNEIIAVSGSSPAFFFRFVQAIVDSAVKLGIDPDIALEMAANTMAGSASMLLNSGRSASELVAQVSSKGGTTVAALSAFDEFGLEDMVNEAAVRCTNRAYELGK